MTPFFFSSQNERELFFFADMAAADATCVTVAILAKDKAHVLPTFLTLFAAQTWPKARTRLYVRTNNNTDDTPNILGTWLRTHGQMYKEIYYDSKDEPEQVQDFSPHEWNTMRFAVLGRIRQASVEWARARGDHYFVPDCDNLFKRTTLATLVATGKPVVAPLLRHPTTSYANFHAAVDARGYFVEDPRYDALRLQKEVGLCVVPVVHCTYLVRAEVLRDVAYADGSGRHEYVVFSDVMRKKGVPQYLDTRQVYGRVLFADTPYDLAAELCVWTPDTASERDLRVLPPSPPRTTSSLMPGGMPAGVVVIDAPPPEAPPEAPPEKEKKSAAPEVLWKVVLDPLEESHIAAASTPLPPQHPIPRLVLQTWSTRRLPAGMCAARAALMATNPTYEFRLFNDDECRDFLADNFPLTVLDAFDALKPGAYRADLWRYCALFVLGGVYVDIKLTPAPGTAHSFASYATQPMIPRDRLPGALWNGLMALPPQSPLAAAAISAVMANVADRAMGTSCLDPSGPTLLRTVLRAAPALGTNLSTSNEFRGAAVNAQGIRTPSGVWIASDPYAPVLIEYTEYAADRRRGTAALPYTDAWRAGPDAVYAPLPSPPRWLAAADGPGASALASLPAGPRLAAFTELCTRLTRSALRRGFQLGAHVLVQTLMQDPALGVLGAFVEAHGGRVLAVQPVAVDGGASTRALLEAGSLGGLDAVYWNTRTADDDVGRWLLADVSLACPPGCLLLLDGWKLGNAIARMPAVNHARLQFLGTYASLILVQV